MIINHRAAPSPVRESGGQHGLRRAVDHAAADGDRLAELPAGLVSLGQIKAAIRRTAWFWCATAICGLLAGIGFYVAFPPSWQASTSLLLTYGPNENPAAAAVDYQAIAGSRAVAGGALHRLGLREDVSRFLASYTVTVVSDRVLRIAVSAPSAGEAVRSAGAVAASFLQLRAQELRTEQTLNLASLSQASSRTRQQVALLSQQIGQLLAQQTSPSQQARLSSLRAQRTQAADNLTALQNAVIGDQTSTWAGTSAAIQGTRVLDSATLVHSSRVKSLLLYPFTGLLLGLAVGVAGAVIQALLSDRPRRRDDVAQALAAPVRLSIRKRRLKWRPGVTDMDSAEVQQIAAYLSGVVPAAPAGPASLAVVPVDDPRVAALSLVSLALSCARAGEHVVVADLCRGAPAAGLLGVRNPGVQPEGVQDLPLAVAVPEPDDILPAGPLRSRHRPGTLRSPLAGEQSPPFTEAVAAACASADLLLTLVALDPSLGGEQLATWTATAVVVLTAGRSPGLRIRAVGEMVHLAGVSLASAVLIGADKADESLGAVPGANDDAAVIEGLAAP
jgi:capsular polysaccharide biosynthesis protein